MNSKYWAHVVRVSVLAAAACLLVGCATVEKTANLTYQRAANVRGGSGEIDLAKPVIEVRLGRMPGRIVLGSVLNTGTQIVTTDDIPEWVMGALIDELHFVGYEIRTVPILPSDVSRGVFVRVTKLSVDQEDSGLLLSTSTEIGLSAEIWKDGRLSKTLTATASSRDEDMDRTGESVAASLQKTLQSAMVELMPGIIDAL
ncbi:MAG: hypothetical protein ABSD38_26605 [Syntrophorhabdales bacterium]|jgi:hypothetical protein